MTKTVGGRIHSKGHRRQSVVAAFVIVTGVLATLAVAPVSAADPPGPAPLITVDAGYVTDGPFVRCAWVLPDADKRSGTGMQYLGDDLREEKPSQGPCSSSGPIVASGNRALAQVVSNPADLPTKRLVELWAAVQHGDGVAGVDGVTFRIFYPDGNFKAEVTAAPVELDACTALGTSGEGDAPEGKTMFGAAVETGQITSGFAGTLATRCGSRALGLYRALIDVSQNEPCGEYRFEIHAYGGAKTIAVHQFDVYCMSQMTVDFDRIGWGALTPGSSKWAFGGDLTRSGIPRVENRGSAGIEVGVRFSAMRPTSGVGAAITSFGAALQPLDGRSEVTRVDIPANEVTWFGTSVALCADEVAALDAAVHPPAGLGEGSYTGVIEVLTRQVAYEAGCNNDLGYWSGPDAETQRVGFVGSGPRPSDPVLAPAVEGAVDTTTTTAPPDTVVAGGSTTTSTTVPGPGGSTTTLPPSTTTTTAPDPTAGYPIPFITVTATFEGSEISALDYTATIQPGVTIGSDAFDLTACWPLLHIDGNGDGYNDGDANRNRAMNPGEGWVFSCGFGQQPNPPVVLPFDPALLLNP